jgi:hypothetical protein
VTFGYALLGALILLLPGLAGYYGTRLGEAGDLVSPRPDRPNSNQTIFLVVFIALIAHTLGALTFGVNEVIAGYVGKGVSLPFEPNPYRVLWNGKMPGKLSGAGFAWELAYSLILTVGTGIIFQRLAHRNPVTTVTAPLRFGWLLPIAKQVEAGSHVVIGYVLTTMGHDGAWIAYEGIVRRLALNDDDAIEMIVLEQCDRFVVRLVDGKVERVDTEGQTIELIQLRNDQVANYALEVLEVATS